MLKSVNALRLFGAVFLATAMLPAMAQACWIRVERPRFVTEIEALNKTIEEGRYADFKANILAAGGMDASSIAVLLEENFPDGFTDCYTIVQREEIGGMEQTISQFVKDNSVLYVLWVTALEGRKINVLSLTVNSDLPAILTELR